MLFRSFTAKVNSAAQNVSSSLKPREKDELTIQIEKDQKQLAELSRNMKKAQEKFEKIDKDFRGQFEEHKKTLKVCSAISTATPNPFEESIRIIEEGEAYADAYSQEIQTEVLAPMKNFLETIIIVEKRVTILEERRKAMNMADDKYHDMLKKPENKQLGLSDLKVNYANTRDSYTYLRDELSVDIKKVLEAVTSNFGQLCSKFMGIYAQYMQKLNSVWQKLEEYADSIHIGDLSEKIAFTETDDSMVGEPNVQKKRDELIAQGLYKEVE